MLKVALLVLFSLVATSWAIDLTQYANVDPTEDQMQAIFTEYMRMAPYFARVTPERYSYFKSQLIDIIHHNRNPLSTWTRTVNRFTGLMPSELSGYAVMDTQTCNLTSSFESSLSRFLDNPTSFDWRNLSMVTPVKNQGSCSASWAFAATGAIESRWAIATNATPTLLSEQQLLDCSQFYGNNGCSGGLPSYAFQSIKSDGGINTENTYFYAMQAEACVFNASVIGAQVPYGAINITAGDEAGILQALVQYGPVAVAFDATQDFLSYSSGIYVGTTCSQSGQSVNLAALIVGYDTDPTTGMDYWICKTSWGSGWGESGYFRIQRGVNMCGIATCASFPGVTAPSEEFISF